MIEQDWKRAYGSGRLEDTKLNRADDGGKGAKISNDRKGDKSKVTFTGTSPCSLGPGQLANPFEQSRNKLKKVQLNSEAAQCPNHVAFLCVTTCGAKLQHRD